MKWNRVRVQLSDVSEDFIKDGYKVTQRIYEAVKNLECTTGAIWCLIYGKGFLICTQEQRKSWKSLRSERTLSLCPDELRWASCSFTIPHSYRGTRMNRVILAIYFAWEKKVMLIMLLSPFNPFFKTCSTWSILKQYWRQFCYRVIYCITAAGGDYWFIIFSPNNKHDKVWKPISYTEKKKIKKVIASLNWAILKKKKIPENFEWKIRRKNFFPEKFSSRNSFFLTILS